MELEEIHLVDVTPVIRRGSRGLGHIGSSDMKRISPEMLEKLMDMLMQRARLAGVILMTKQVDGILMIAWAP